ncbi:hypothetical protein ON010_g11135 [Phytophthora cinnamomi]|nr:hypothetical protein ON010_g11135 [Phytophthora cinnamomi]
MGRWRPASLWTPAKQPGLLAGGNAPYEGQVRFRIAPVPDVSKETVNAQTVCPRLAISLGQGVTPCPPPAHELETPTPHTVHFFRKFYIRAHSRSPGKVCTALGLGSNVVRMVSGLRVFLVMQRPVPVLDLRVAASCTAASLDWADVTPCSPYIMQWRGSILLPPDPLNHRHELGGPPNPEPATGRLTDTCQRAPDYLIDPEHDAIPARALQF